MKSNFDVITESPEKLAKLIASCVAADGTIYCESCPVTSCHAGADCIEEITKYLNSPAKEKSTRK